jgi:hypothetical protein
MMRLHQAIVAAIRSPAIAAAFAVSLATAGPAEGGTRLVWVLADQPDATSSYTPNSAHSFASSSKPITVTRGNTGDYGVFSD